MTLAIMLRIVGTTWKRICAISVGITTLVSPLIPVAAQAAPPDPSLMGWSFHIVTTYTQQGPNDYYWRDRATYDSQAGSFELSWVASVNRRTPTKCGDEYIIGDEQAADGSGTGMLEGPAGGSPADYNLPTSKSYVSVIPGGEQTLNVSLSVHTCPGETFVYNRMEQPYTHEVFIEGTLESVAALPSGTVLEDAYEVVKVQGEYTTTYAVSYRATKGPVSNRACSDGLDNDGDGLSDLADPGCSDPSDSSETGTLRCDNGLDDDADGRADFRLGGGDPGCSSPSDDDESDCLGNTKPEAVLVGEPVDWRGDSPDMRFWSESSDFDGDAVSTAWTFTDMNGTRTATGPTADVAWSAAGFSATSPPRVATITVTDPCGESDSASIAFRVTGDPTVDFAPVAHLHPSEEYWPMRPKTFLSKSSLKYALPNRPDKTVNSDPSSDELGAGAYPVRDNGLRLSSDDFTRPYAEGKAPKCPTCGYYLDLPTKYQKGDKPTGAVVDTDMIVQSVKDKIVYWMFYGLSQATTYGGKPTRGIKHQGDWERVVVDLNATTLVPQNVGYVAHHDPVHWVPLPPMRSSSSTVSDAFALNPQAYVSRLGHGTWHDVGVFKTCKFLVACAYDYTSAGGYVWDGAVNQTGTQTQSWFGSAAEHGKCLKGAPMPRASLSCGFGGAWGHSGSSGDQTGPAGPSAYKTATEN